MVRGEESPALSAAQCREVVAAARDAIFRLRGTAKRAWERLARDILLVAAGARPAAMVDYAVIPAAGMAAILCAVRAALPPGAAADLHMLEIEGCMYPCRLGALVRGCARRLPGTPVAEDPRGVDGPPAVYVMLQEGFPPRCAGGAEASALAAGLQPILGALERAEEAARAGGGGGAEAPTRGVTWHRGGILSVDLQAASGLPFCSSGPAGGGVEGEERLRPLLPTVNGWLLGYPAVYAVTPANADSAAAVLSRCTLDLFSVALPCPLLSDCAAPGSGSGSSAARSSNPMCASGDDVLYSFTAPRGLAVPGAPLGSAALAALKSALRRAFEAQPGRVWGAPQVTVSARAPGPVAL